MKNEKFYVVNDYYYIATNCNIKLLKNQLINCYDIDVKSIREISSQEYFNWLSIHENCKCKTFYF